MHKVHNYFIKLCVVKPRQKLFGEHLIKDKSLMGAYYTETKNCRK